VGDELRNPCEEATVQARDVMTAEVVTVGPETSAKHAGELMAGHGVAALPVVDGGHRLVGMVAEADVLRDRIPPDPRLHLRRATDQRDALPLQVGGLMTAPARAVDPAADVADLARLFVDAHLPSVPVVEDGVVVGIVSRGDVLRTLVRPDRRIRSDVLRLVEACTDDLGSWDVRVTEGVTTVRRTQGAPEVASGVEEFALERLVRTVPGVVAVHVLPAVPQSAAGARS
jgi:CBS domain-containing protein